MAIGNWDDDFRSKYGFNDGSSAEDRDFAARALIVKEVNKLDYWKKAGVIAMEFNRGGMHNPCMILLRPATMTDKGFLEGNMPEPHEPEDTSEFGGTIDEIVCEAYAAVSRPVRRKPSKRRKAK